MRFVKIKPGIISVVCRGKELKDKQAVYPFNKWSGEDALDLIKRGFLIEVNQDGTDIGSTLEPTLEPTVEELLDKKIKKKK